MNKHLRQFLFATNTLCLAACASAPGEQPAELVSNAERLLSQGVSRFSEDNYAAALLHFRRALDEYRLIDDADGAFESSINIARTRLAMNQVDKASEWVAAADRLIAEYQPARANEYRETTALLEASILFREGDTAAATEILNTLVNSQNRTSRLNSLDLRTRIAFATATDQQTWLERYRQAIKQNAQASTLHTARLLRYEAELQTTKPVSDSRYEDALKLYRKLAHKRGIAATLQEWSASDSEYGAYVSAEQKLLRALYIRASLKDQRNLKRLFQQYQQLAADNGMPMDRAERVQYWNEELDKPGFNRWNTVMAEFGTYPK